MCNQQDARMMNTHTHNLIARKTDTSALHVHCSCFGSNCDNTIYTIMIITLRHFLFNLIKDAEWRHNKIMFRVRCPKIFPNEFGVIESLSFSFFFSDRSVKSSLHLAFSCSSVIPLIQYYSDCFVFLSV